MVIGRRIKTKRNWTKAIKYSDGSILYYGRRSACYFILHTEGFGKGFAYEEDMQIAIKQFNHSRLGVNQ